MPDQPWCLKKNTSETATKEHPLRNITYFWCGAIYFKHFQAASSSPWDENLHIDHWPVLQVVTVTGGLSFRTIAQLLESLPQAGQGLVVQLGGLRGSARVAAWHQDSDEHISNTGVMRSKAVPVWKKITPGWQDGPFCIGPGESQNGIISMNRQPWLMECRRPW